MFIVFLAPLILSNPLLTSFRPPEQTQGQNAVQKGMVANAKAASDAKAFELKTLFAAGRADMAGLPCENETDDTLLEILQYEFSRLPIIHNAPVTAKEAAVPDDTDLFTNLANGYMQSVPQRFVFGVEDIDNMFGESAVMSKYLGFPWYGEGHISLRESNEKMVYLANNWEKKDCGNFQYGFVTYVINPIYADKFFVAPFDTGKYAGARCGDALCPTGTFTDFNHVIVEHINTYQYSLGKVFKRWYTPGGGPLIANGTNFVYFEIEWAGAAWLPESLLYIIAKYDHMWGNNDGYELQEWMLDNQRPLVWSNSDNSGMLMDPVVDWYGYDKGPVITPADKKYFLDNWASVPTPGNGKAMWTALYNGAQTHTQLEYRSWYTKTICDADEKDPGKMIMGVNKAGWCVFWAFQPPIEPALLNQQFMGPR
jgi:hypothetical protein